ncbi:hypothetical protein VNO78_20593 [Psophocarpus tetragonolobus]|uniref:Coenzyme Q-binding protein COQ10 START domain-containing protein n=1 Tax=Psophocarpus tetragonolobus TaxID=3891 RepID=A0AAN9SDN6_PSOTE
MRGIPVSSESHCAFLFPQHAPSFYSNSTPITHSSLFFCHPFHFKPHHSISIPKPCSFKFGPFLCCTSKSDPTTLHDDDDDDYCSSGNLLVEEGGDGIEESGESLVEDGVWIEVTKLDKNSRRIQSRIAIEAPLSAIWNLLTDYERLADFIPGLAVSQLLQRGDNFARLLQIGQQNLAFGIKFNAKGIVDCYEKELETLPSGMRREIEFKMIEGDFQLFEGKWSILQQFNSDSTEQSQVREVRTTLQYIVDVKPKLWLPIRLIEGRLCDEIKTNLVSVRDEAQKANQGTGHTHQSNETKSKTVRATAELKQRVSNVAWKCPSCSDLVFDADNNLTHFSPSKPNFPFLSLAT